MDSDMHKVEDNITWYYTGPERRQANKPRRAHDDRRYRLRNEALISDFRLDTARRQEDVDGFVEINGLSSGQDRLKPGSKDSH
jgi:hypothetical protein